ncbi:MAG: transcriptional repressor [Clostridia bacterium]|nr:transcriptional repressor [Clostridia bacterium]
MANQRHSRKRDAILECIRSTTSHPTADWIYAQLKPEITDLSLGTVYRNIAAFKKEGLVSSIGVIDGMERFDGNTMAHPHFICTCCNSVIDVDDVPPAENFAESVKCGKVTQMAVTFTGICNECVKNSSKH